MISRSGLRYRSSQPVLSRQRLIPGQIADEVEDKAIEDGMGLLDGLIANRLS